jgi:tricorn protease interacting factor F2/3
LHVRSYDLFLDLDFKALKFDGRVVIDLDSTGDVGLNSLGLEILKVQSNSRQFQHVQNGEDLVVKTGPFSGKLEVEYRGKVSDALVGLYKAPIGDTYVLSTQFEAAAARRLLPCVDHPAYKAEFRLTVRLDPDLSIISNMPPESAKTDGDGKTVVFPKTPRMSTYLLYLGVGKFDETTDKLGSVDMRIATTPGKAKKTRFAMDVAKESVKWYETYFGSAYQLPKLHLIGVPEFAQGAMENWGAITFREVLLLVDENTSVRVKKLVAEVIAHEVAHMWFGNLVTMKWWDDLWLNESFATFMAYKVVDAAFPQWKVWHDFVRVDTSTGMSRDSLMSTHPIEVTIIHPSEIEQIFDEISYSKGGSVLRMIEAYTGLENFRNGVRTYLENYRFSNATGNDLWTSLEKFSGAQVKRIMNEWVRKPGYPVITASYRDGALVLKQERFLLSGVREKSVWPVPVTMKVNGNLEKMLLDREEDRFKVPEGLTSLKLNFDQTGFYRVYYDNLYGQVWNSRPSAVDRFGVISDAYAFTISGRMPFQQYESLVSRFIGEEEYLPAHEVSDQLASLYSLTPRAGDLSAKFHRSLLKTLGGRSDENSIMLRGVASYRLGLVDDEFAKDLSGKFLDYESAEPDMRQAVAAGYARTTGDFDGIVEKYRKTTSDEEKVRFLAALMSFKDTALIDTTFAFAKSNEVKRQDVGGVLLASGRNPQARDAVWNWLRANLDWLSKLYEGTGIVSRLLREMIPYAGIGRAPEVERFFAETKAEGAEKGVEGGVEKLRIYDGFVKNIERSRTEVVEAI